MKVSPEEFIETRKRLGLSQVKLAEALGLASKTIEGFEQGKTSIRPAYILAMRQLEHEKEEK
jgi:transcriptional regulator with XRE-family HTH domain